MTLHDHPLPAHDLPRPAEHGHLHAAPHPDRDRQTALPLSLMAQSSAVRLGGAALVVALLWLAVLWAVSLP